MFAMDRAPHLLERFLYRFEIANHHRPILRLVSMDTATRVPRAGPD